MRTRTVPQDLPSNYKYIPGLSDRQRVDMVLQQLHEQHRWSLKSFHYHLVTAQPEEKHSWSTEYRARKLFEAIYEKDKVMECFPLTIPRGKGIEAFYCGNDGSMLFFLLSLLGSEDDLSCLNQ
jgi:hypothetical protein